MHTFGPTCLTNANLNVAHLSLRTAPTSPSSPASSPPSQLSIQQAVQKALLDMHGVVGSAIAVDILHVGRPSQSQPLSRTEAESGDEPADRKETAEAVLRVGTE